MARLVYHLWLLLYLLSLSTSFHLRSPSRCKLSQFVKRVDDIPVTTINPDESGRLPAAIEYMLGIRQEPKQTFKSFKRKEVLAVHKKLKDDKFSRRVARQPHYAERFKKFNESEEIRRMHARLAEKFEGKKNLIAEAERRAMPFKGFGAAPVYHTNIIEPRDQDLMHDDNFPNRGRYSQPIEVPMEVYERKPEDGRLSKRPTPFDVMDEDGYDDDDDDDEEDEEEEEKKVKGNQDHRNNYHDQNDHEHDFDERDDDDDQEEDGGDYYEKILNRNRDADRSYDDGMYDREYDEYGNEVRPVMVKPKKRGVLNPKNLTRSGPLNALGGYRFRKPPPVDPVVVERQRQEEQTTQEKLKEVKEKKKQKRQLFEKAQYFPFHFKEKPNPDDDDDDANGQARNPEEEGEKEDDIFIQSSFSDLGITNRVILNNLERMGVKAPTKIQGLVIPALMEGNKDVVIEAQTGSGKTLAFLLPLIGTVNPMLKKVQAIIIASSRELVVQITEVAASLFAGTPYEVLNVIGGANARHQIETLRDERPQIIIATPGRLAEMVFGMEHIHLGNVRAIVIDEVDHLLQEPYVQDIENLMNVIPMLHPSVRAVAREEQRGYTPHPHYDYRRMVCFASATGNSTLVRDFCNKHCRDDWNVMSVSSQSRLPASITHCMVTVPRIRSLEWLVKVLNAQPEVQSALIFVNDPHRVEFLAKKLLEFKKIAAPLHGDATKEDRKEILLRLRDGRVQFVITTEIAARGLDIPELTHVINFELPTDVEHYIHRSGRCGRLGREGLVINFATKETKFVLRRFSKRLDIDLHDCEIRDGQLYLRNATMSAVSENGASCS